MNESTEVVVIGGGAVGCSVAYNLAKEGVDVALVERGEIASGTSGACQGGIQALTYEPPLTDLVLESQKIYRGLEEELQYDIEYDNCGLLVCADREDQLQTLEERVKNLQKWGVAARLIDKDEVRKIDPILSKDILGALIRTEDAVANPIRIAFGYASAAKKAGAKIYTFNEVENITTKGNEVESVITDKRKIKANFIVNTAGVWSPFIGEMVGLKIPVTPQRGQIIVSEPSPRSQVRYVLDADYLTTAFNPDAVKRSKNQRIKLGVAASIIQTESGNWLLGSSRDLVGFNRKTSLKTLEFIAKRCIKFIPQLKHINCIRTYAGLRPITPNGLPILAKVKDLDGFVISTGHHGEGLMLSPITGKLISELITKGRTSISIEKFGYSRFEQHNVS